MYRPQTTKHGSIALPFTLLIRDQSPFPNSDFSGAQRSALPEQATTSDSEALRWMSWDLGEFAAYMQGPAMAMAPAVADPSWKFAG